MIKKQNKTIAPEYLRCKLKNEQKHNCNRPMQIYEEGSGKYWIYICEVHGLVAVLKGSRRK